MDIDVPVKDLGSVDMDDLRNAILSLDESAWESQTYRQTQYEVHNLTKSIVLLFTTGDGWPDIKITQESGWDMLSDVACPVMDSILAEHYPEGGTIIRAMVANLPAGSVVSTHFDSHPSFFAGHRIHIPITTNRRVRFTIDGRNYRFEVGKAYELNNQKTHSVMNKGKEDRLHFIFDYVPPDQVCNPTFLDQVVAAD